MADFQTAITIFCGRNVAMGETVIKLDGVWKRYGLIPALQEWRRTRKKSGIDPGGQWPLRDINFEVKQGETIGIIGRNGAGKSTLLKILAGVTPPTRGKVEVKGRIFPMIELNAGLHMDLTGRENIYLLGSIMGLSRAEIRSLLPDIEEFSELGDYFDQPVRKYSSGMMARLGFSVAINVRAEILLIDEVFSVGDVAFQQKCFRKMEEIIKSGCTILFVTHAMRNLERICDKALLMDKGEIVKRGTPLDIIASYFECVSDLAAQELLKQSDGVVPIIHTGSGEIRVTGADILDSRAVPAKVVPFHEPFIVRLYILVERSIKSPHLMIILSTPDLINVAAVSTGRVKMIDLPDFSPGEWIIDCRMAPSNLLPGVYMLNAAFDSKDGPKIETVRHIKQFQVVTSGHGQQENNMPGFFWLDCDWECREK
jgi:lipopolysaccharide transport system ATP-binding protein